MAGDQPSAGFGSQDPAGGQGGVPPRPGVDPAAVADQMTQLDGSAIPAQAAPPGAPVTPGAAPGAPGLSYQPTAPAFPAQGTPPPPGAPVGPYDPQPSYGYPQQAPPAPAYGAQQGGYPPPPQTGYPAPPQFGQQQPGPAYGGFPGPGPVQPPSPPVKQRNPVMVFGAVAGSVLAVAIVIGLVVLFTGNTPKNNTSGGTTGGGGGGGGTSTTGQLAVSWNVPKADGSTTDLRTLGDWVTDKLVIRGDSTALTAYNLSDGKVAWTLKAPDGTKAFCSMSKAVNKNNIGGVSFNLGDDDCAAVGAIDATTGRLIYKVGSPLSSKSFGTQVTVTDTTLAAASGSLLAGYNLTDGSNVWSYKDRGQYCSDNADAADTVVVVSDYCSDTDTKQALLVLDANTGKTTQSFSLGDNERLTNIVSAKPLVVQISNGYDNDYFVGVDSSGNAEAKIPLKTTGEDRLQLSAYSDPMTKSLVLGNTLYVEVDNSGKTSIRAIDLVGGKTLWTVDGGAQSGLRLVDKTSTSTPTAIAMNGYGKGAQVVTLSPTDGSVTQVESFSSKSSDDSFLTFQDSQVLLSDAGPVLTIPQLPVDSTITMYTKH
ncbi:PQQ-binding-like beta-propeller repeat protein [Kitasatospora sp. NBC_01287]|uniref:outer membrane protein assembly factor BamB family protein n=1 Tax=Kitasatospora sp. NBC_01287 TaxID=2903573 RepID=UPI0022515ACF|nr:PQQ-binding-like beta-propeller repeat protein [Kitasatospora sp. NBC_01287]MCX4746304.1 PQQ-binding-like beta-propeller repeat protein [Kitasatospora sp. NBC_01287]